MFTHKLPFTLCLPTFLYSRNSLRRGCLYSLSLILLLQLFLKTDVLNSVRNLLPPPCHMLLKATENSTFLMPKASNLLDLPAIVPELGHPPHL